MIDLIQIEKQLNESLDKETTESLLEWLNNKRNSFTDEVEIDKTRSLTLEEITKKREYRTVYLLISALANMCAATEETIIDYLTGYLWNEEEAKQIKQFI